MQYVKGVASRQAHVRLPAGTVEEEHGREGFSGRASHLYRLHPPTGWSRIEGPLRPHAFDAAAAPAAERDLPAVLLRNDDLMLGMIRHAARAEPSHLQRSSRQDQASSNRSRFMTFSHAATKSCTNAGCESSHA